MHTASSTWHASETGTLCATFLFIMKLTLCLSLYVWPWVIYCMAGIVQNDDCFKFSVLFTKADDILLGPRNLFLQFEHTIISWQQSCIVRADVQIAMAISLNSEIPSTRCSFGNTFVPVDANSTAAGDWGPSALMFFNVEVLPSLPR